MLNAVLTAFLLQLDLITKSLYYSKETVLKNGVEMS